MKDAKSLGWDPTTSDAEVVEMGARLIESLVDTGTIPPRNAPLLGRLLGLTRRLLDENERLKKEHISVCGVFGNMCDDPRIEFRFASDAAQIERLEARVAELEAKK